MKKYFLSAIAVVILAVTLCVGALAADVTVGTADELVAIMNDQSRWGDNITLTADIDLTDKVQAPIGNYTTPYTGIFDGAGFTIKGLNINTIAYQLTPAAPKEGEEPAPVDPNAVYATVDDIAVGLFGVINNATIKNLTVEGIVANNFAAASAETKIEGKYSGTGAVAGVVLTNCTLENVVNKANVLGTGNTGGVAGIVYNFGADTVNIVNCANYGIVDSTVGNVGGVVGRIYTKSTSAAEKTDLVVATVDGCVNYADLEFTPEDRQRGGGVIGYIRSEEGRIVVKNCRNEGDISGSNNGQFSTNIPYIGGIIGRNEMATTSAKDENGVSVIVTGLTSAIEIRDCINVGNITSSRLTGGITAYISRGEACNINRNVVSGCVNLGDVNGSYFAASIVTYAELNGAVNQGVIENCLNTGNITSTYFEGKEYENTGSNQEAIGGIIARNRGASIKNCVTVGTVTTEDSDRVLSGTLVGKMDSDMTVPCDISGNYYLYAPMSIGLTTTRYEDNTAIGSADVVNKDTYSGLDFENTWVMGEKVPVLAGFAGEVADVTVKEGIVVEEKQTTGPIIPVIPPVTTAPVTTTGTTDTAEGGSFPVGIVIGIVAAVVAIAVVVTVVVKNKK